MKIRVEATGQREVMESLSRMGKAGTECAKVVLKRFAERILAKARPLVPVDDVDGGDLRDSGRLTRPTATKNAVSAGVMFGGLNVRGGAIYPIKQHEDLTLKHRHGQAKFLEQPFFQEAPGVPDALMAELDKVAALEGVR